MKLNVALSQANKTCHPSLSSLLLTEPLRDRNPASPSVLSLNCFNSTDFRCVLNSLTVLTLLTVKCQCIDLNKYRSQTDPAVACVTSFVGRTAVGWVISWKLALQSPVQWDFSLHFNSPLSTMDWLKTEASQKPFCLLALNGRKSCCWCSAVLKCNLNTC